MSPVAAIMALLAGLVASAVEEKAGVAAICAGIMFVGVSLSSGFYGLRGPRKVAAASGLILCLACIPLAIVFLL
jgi:hypothetical protein